MIEQVTPERDTPIHSAPRQGAIEPMPAAPTGWVRRHPIAAFFTIALAFSWAAWLPWAFGEQEGAAAALFIVGGLGPPIAAAIVVRATGGSVRAWARGLLDWRVPGRYWAFALGLGPALLLVINAALAMIGYEVDLAALPERVLNWIVSLVVIAIVGGGLEELGWRHFALPRLQRRFSPLAATFLLGFVWGAWHIPAYGTPLAIVVPLVLATFYTWLYNASGSVLLCVVLHGNITASIDQLLLTRDSTTVDLTIFGAYVAATVAVIVFTKGRLGYRTRADERLPGEPQAIEAVPSEALPGETALSPTPG